MPLAGGQLETGLHIDGGTDNTAIGNISDYLQVFDGVNTAATYGNIVVGTTAIPLRVGGANLANRKVILFQVVNDTVTLGWDSSLTAANGIPLFKDQMISLKVGPNITPYIIGNGAGKNVRVAELS